ncbi:MAG TPA: hypothetical protein VGX78_20575 [Pirellulales bacterium]|nr:hypothetical protein [Pirellulales bacterium]
MTRMTATGLILLAGLTMTAAPAGAGDDESPARLTLGDRLDRIRRVIVGEADDDTTTDSPARPAEPKRKAQPHVTRQDAVPAKSASSPSNKPSSRRESPMPTAQHARSAQARGASSSKAPIKSKSASPTMSDVKRRPKERAPAPLGQRVARADRSKTMLEAQDKKTERGTAAGKLLLSQQGPRLSIETAGPRRLIVGQMANYKVTVHNEGECQADDVHVSIRLPDSAEVGESRPSMGKATRGESVIDWSIASLSAGGRAELLLPIAARENRAFDLAVRWSAATSTAETTIEVQEPKLELHISGPSDVRCGAKEVYRLTVSNPGSGDADDVVVHLLPLDDESEGASQKIGTLPGGKNSVVEIELMARQGGHLTIQAEATGAGGLKAKATQRVNVKQPALTLAVAGPKKHFSGTTAGYQVRLTNPGDSDAQQVKVTTQLPANTEFVSATHDGHFDEQTRRVTWTLGKLPAGAEEILTLKCVPSATGESRLDVTATADGVEKRTASAVTHVVAHADVVLEVADPTGPVALGADAVYEIRIRNRGNKQADGVDVVAFFSKDIEPVSAEGGPHEIAPGTVMFEPIESLEAGGKRVFKIHAQAGAAGSHRFRVELTCKSTGAVLSQEETTLYYRSDSGNDEAAHVWDDRDGE